MLKWEITSLNKFWEMGTHPIPEFKTKENVQAFLEQLKDYGDIVAFEVKNRVHDICQDIFMTLLIKKIKDEKIDKETLETHLDKIVKEMVTHEKETLDKLLTPLIEMELERLHHAMTQMEEDIKSLKNFKKNLKHKNKEQREKWLKLVGTWVGACTQNAASEYGQCLKDENYRQQVAIKTASKQSNKMTLQSVPQATTNLLTASSSGSKRDLTEMLPEQLNKDDLSISEHKRRRKKLN